MEWVGVGRIGAGEGGSGLGIGLVGFCACVRALGDQTIGHEDDTRTFR